MQRLSRDHFGSAADWGVPELDLSWQATDVPDPIVVWGSFARSRVPAGCTVCFYTWDYLFTGLWKKRTAVSDRGVAVAVEPNFSTYPSQPLALSLYETFRKRTLAKGWAERGVKLLVDLNAGATPEQECLNLLGVPDGWRAFALRAHRETGLAGLERDLETARLVAGTDDLVLLVYGGSRAVREWALNLGAAWRPEHNDRVRGRETGRERKTIVQASEG